jgi:hypothetical protein
MSATVSIPVRGQKTRSRAAGFTVCVKQGNVMQPTAARRRSACGTTQDTEDAMGRIQFAVALTAALAVAVPMRLAAQEPSNGASGTPAAPAAGSASVSDATIAQVGKALRKVEEIRQTYAQRIQAATSQDQQQGLSQQAAAEAQQAVRSQGLSPQQYNDVIRLAQNDMGLRKRLIAAAGLPAQPQ